MIHFSEKLRQLLKEKEISQKAFYTKINASKNQLHYWINNKAEPDLELLKRIVVELGVSADYLLGLEDEFGNKLY